MAAVHTGLIQMWSGPRNVSTAMMYAFAQREDTEVVDEPFYGAYLRATGLQHPGREQVLAAMPEPMQRIVKQLIEPSNQYPVRFAKQMAHHLRCIDDSYLGRSRNFILTRAPSGVLTSLVNQIPEPGIDDTGYPEQIELLDRFPNIPVIDATALLRNPESVLQQLCDRLSLPFDPAMLTWPSGPKPYDGVWADWWYNNVHKSTGFSAPRPIPAASEVPDQLQPLLAQCQPLYDRLAAVAIQP